MGGVGVRSDRSEGDVADGAGVGGPGAELLQRQAGSAAGGAVGPPQLSQPQRQAGPNLPSYPFRQTCQFTPHLLVAEAENERDCGSLQ